MIEKTIGEIEAKIRGAEAVSEERKRELLQLLATLKTEAGALEKTHREQAQSIAGFAQLSAHEATRGEKNPQLRELSMRGLQSSVEGFEKSNPRLVEIVNAISNSLSNWGI
jgi:queuine/archaeosine tRNA-ribosyltransferase